MLVNVRECEAAVALSAPNPGTKLHSLVTRLAVAPDAHHPARAARKQQLPPFLARGHIIQVSERAKGSWTGTPQFFSSLPPTTLSLI